MTPPFSVVMATRNRLEQLQLTLPRTLELDPPELIIVDDGSDDDTMDFVDSLVPPEILRYIRLDNDHYRINPGPVWNVGCEKATGEILIHQGPDIYPVSDNAYGRLCETVTRFPWRVWLARVWNAPAELVENLPPIRGLQGREWLRTSYELGGGHPIPTCGNLQIYTGAERTAPLIFFGATHSHLWKKLGGYDDMEELGSDQRFAERILNEEGVWFAGLGDVVAVHLWHDKT